MKRIPESEIKRRLAARASKRMLGAERDATSEICKELMADTIAIVTEVQQLTKLTRKEIAKRARISASSLNNLVTQRRAGVANLLTIGKVARVAGRRLQLRLRLGD
jgi:hypothetical protein